MLNFNNEIASGNTRTTKKEDTIETIEAVIKTQQTESKLKNRKQQRERVQFYL